VRIFFGSGKAAADAAAADGGAPVIGGEGTGSDEATGLSPGGIDGLATTSFLAAFALFL